MMDDSGSFFAIIMHKCLDSLLNTLGSLESKDSKHPFISSTWVVGCYSELG
jgi:hypothetical protein